MTDALPTLQTALADRYRFEKELGRGGMATVFLAHELASGQAVALKVLNPELAKTVGADRFKREIRVAGSLDHPNILGVLDSGEVEDLLWFTMPYVQGENLQDLMQREQQLTTERAMAITRAVGSALAYAHEQGVIHRDIKPDNILLGKDGSVKLTDFGLARAIEGDPNLSQTGRVFGTPHFMAPEQALGERVDQRSDIFSLGATLYRIVTGRYPFQATTLMAVVFKLTHETRRSLQLVLRRDGARRLQPA